MEFCISQCNALDCSMWQINKKQYEPCEFIYQKKNSLHNLIRKVKKYIYYFLKIYSNVQQKYTVWTIFRVHTRLGEFKKKKDKFRYSDK